MINKKISRILGPVLGIMGFMLTAGAMEMPALADTTSITQTTTTGAAVTNDTENKDYSMNINKSETQNGVTVTVEKAMATKHNLKVVLKIESEKPFDEMTHSNSIFEVNYGDNDYGFTLHSQSQNINDKTKIITLEKENNRGEYPEKGDMRVDVVIANFKVNIGIDVPVDFSESFKNIIDKDISGKIPEFDYTLKSMESDVMGTKITYSEPKKDEDSSDKEDSLWNSVMILKTGNIMYKLDSNGNYMGGDKEFLGNYESKILTYDKVKNEKNISIIPIICNMTMDEMDKINEEDRIKEVNDTKDSKNNISYEKEFSFSDGTKGEIYNIERNENSIKVYCKGESEKESLLLASNIDMHYEYIKGQTNKIYYDNSSITFYKDPKEALGYIVEFDNVDKEKGVEINFYELMKQVDKYKLEDEIILSK